MDWLLIVGIVAVAALVLAVAGALRITSDGYRGVHTGRETYPARHVATGLDDPTTQIIARGTARVSTVRGNSGPGGPAGSAH